MKKIFQKVLVTCTAISLTVGALSSLAGEKIDQSLALDNATHVNIENLRGEVTITGWDQDKVMVVGELDDDAKGLMFEQNGSTINIKVKMPRRMNSGRNQEGSVLDIKIPQQLKLSFNGVSTDVNVSNLTQSADIRTVSGNISANALATRIELNTVSGDIHCKNLSGDISLSAVSGDINDRRSQGTLKISAVSGSLSSDTKANEVFANTVSGEIDLTLSKTDELSVSTVSGDVDARLALNEDGRLKMSSVSGDIDMHFTNEVQASFRLKSNASGDLVNKLTEDEVIKAKYGPSSKLYFETGNGNAAVKGSTVSGRIKISG